MQDVQPSSSLKLSPKPQLFHCMNKHAQLLSAKAALLALPSTVLFSPGRAKSSSAPDGNIGAEVTKSLFFGHLFTCHISASSLVFSQFLLSWILVWIPPVLCPCCARQKYCSHRCQLFEIEISIHFCFSFPLWRFISRLFVDDLNTNNLLFTVFTNTHIMSNSRHLSRAYGVEMFKLALYTLT